MARCLIPLELDLRPLPPLETVAVVPVDVAQVMAHRGAAAGALTARLEDGSPIPAQATGSAVHLHLPARIAAGETTRITLTAQEAPAAAMPARVVCSQGPDAVDVRIDGRPFATYRYNTADPDLPRPYFHPLLGSAGVPLTQDGEFPGTRQGHIWHTGLVLAHQKFTDGNNWQTGSPQFSRMRHVAFDAMESGPVLGRFIQRLDWLNVKGDRVVFREKRTVTLPARDPRARYLDIETILTCGDQPAVWEATPYQLLAIRVPDGIVPDKGGVITSSEGAVNQAVAGKPAAWLDFSGPLGGGCGVALFNHPRNPRHPTDWLNFENETVGAAPTYHQPLPWAPGESRTFRYRVLLHAGDVKQGRVAEEYAAYTAAVDAKVGTPVLA